MAGRPLFTVDCLLSILFKSCFRLLFLSRRPDFAFSVAFSMISLPYPSLTPFSLKKKQKLKHKPHESQLLGLRQLISRKSSPLGLQSSRVMFARSSKWCMDALYSKFLKFFVSSLVSPVAVWSLSCPSRICARGSC